MLHETLTHPLSIVWRPACRFADAVAHFSRCIQLDAGNEVYFSNRAAAHMGLKQYSEAAQDAKSVIQLKPKWVKGWGRLGAALSGLEDFSGVCPSLSSSCSCFAFNAKLFCTSSLNNTLARHALTWSFPRCFACGTSQFFPAIVSCIS